MESSITLALQNLQKAVTCSICLEYFSHPVTVLCGHSFCKTCMDQALLHNSRCPICSSKIRKRTNELNDGLQPLIDKIANFVDSCQPNHKNNDSKTAATLSGNRESSTEGTISVLTVDTRISGPRAEPVGTSSAVISTASMGTSILHNTPFAVGSLVNVKPRLWIGINKPGGTGRVVSVTDITDKDVITTLYTVKYVLDSRTETDINEVFVEPYCELDRSSRKSKTACEQLWSVVSTCADKSTNSDRSMNTEDESSAHKKQKISGVDGTNPVPCGIDTGNAYWSREPGPTDSSTGSHKYARGTATATSSTPIIKNNRTAPIVMLSTSLDPELQSKLQQLADQCPGVVVINSFSSAVTHLIVSTDKDRTMKQRTMKYMQALIAGIWIVSVEWVIDSLDKHCIQAEATYEVRKNSKAVEHFAPRRARLAAAQYTELVQADTLKDASSSTKATSNLFENYLVLLYGQFPTPGPPRSDIHYLLERGGATVCASVKDFLRDVTAKRSNTHRHKVVVCSAKHYGDEFIGERPSTVLTEDLYIDMTMAELCTQEKIVTLSHTWVLDSAVNYKVLPLNYPLT